MAAKRIFVK